MKDWLLHVSELVRASHHSLGYMGCAIHAWERVVGDCWNYLLQNYCETIGNYFLLCLFFEFCLFYEPMNALKFGPIRRVHCEVVHERKAYFELRHWSSSNFHHPARFTVQLEWTWSGTGMVPIESVQSASVLETSRYYESIAFQWESNTWWNRC